ncbi:endonuclease MutS2 [Leptolyngbya sp. FACHB-261]|uniref:endonuclease MutS2 n=1 Tax=Leptolyngbya sp. FACHB-261 TaxID=2692806 RepID=UPI00168209F4|nr:endonuclease MutS2 [Leptolyngbya sp. FACHB-261]MBD2099466.1 endonuclease MutS2 [Leptolyngbya sp. FACHB-261]
MQFEALELLEWPRLCQHLSTFAATKLGSAAARGLPLPATQADSEALLAQTREATTLENRLASGLPLEGIHDIGAAVARAGIGGTLGGEELAQIAETLGGVRNLRRALDDQEDMPVLQELVSHVRTYPELEQEIHRCIDEQGRVSDRASDKLAGLRERLRQVRDQIYQTLQNLIQRKANAIQENLIAQRSERFVIPVKAPQKDAVPGIVHDASGSGATLYIEPHAVVPLNNQLRTLARQEQAEEEAIRARLSGQVGEVQEDLEHLLFVVTAVDLAIARARYGLWLGANSPRFIASDESIVLRQLRHPLLVWQQQHERGNAVVPVDLLIRPQIRTVVITGPNTGGKTVTLKTLGLAALMARAGLFVPAREPVELPWFEFVLADIGDEQSLEQSLSTFSGHIRRISRILETMTDQSLVLLDEVGAGTDPSEGSALATALLQELAERSRLSIATTHFGELKALKYQDERFENASVEFDDVSLAPTYRLLWGIPGRSNALTIAGRLGMGSTILERARGYVGSSSEAVNDVIAGLEAQRRTQEERAHEAADLLANTERLHREVANRATALRERERQLQQQQEQAIAQAIAEAKSEIAKVIRRLQKGTPTAQDASAATEALNQAAAKFLPSQQAPPKRKPSYQPQVGERVRIPRLGQVAEVLSSPDDDNELTVRFGLMKMTVSLSDIESLDGQKPEPTAKKEKAPPPPKATELPPAAAEPIIRTSHNTLDLRGSRVSDAELMLDRALAEASGALWIIHGHGTGRLRQAVQDFLKQYRRVERYEFAERTDGGTGVTVAYLKP